MLLALLLLLILCLTIAASLTQHTLHIEQDGLSAHLTSLQAIAYCYISAAHALKLSNCARNIWCAEQSRAAV
jgi:competence protein ComGC